MKFAAGRSVKLLSWLVAATFCSTILVFAGTLVSAPSASAATPAQDEEAFIRSINELRASRGLPAMTVHPMLTVIARDFAPKMAANGKIFHNPELSNQAPETWLKLGENVGVGNSVTGLHQAFVDSPGHLRNLLDPSYRYIGVGVFHQNGRMWVVHDFMASNAPLPQVSPPRSHVTEKSGMATRYQLALQHYGA